MRGVEERGYKLELCLSKRKYNHYPALQLCLCQVRMLSCAGGMRQPGCRVQLLLGWSRWGGKRL